MAAVVRLCWAYRRFLITWSEESRRVAETFYGAADYARLMQQLPRIHARPKGEILLVDRHGAAVGCGMRYPFSPGVTEIKRVYLGDGARGAGMGRHICQALIDGARADGFDRVVLDTAVSLTQARALYESMGFQARGPFYDLPDSARTDLCFYEKTL